MPPAHNPPLRRSQRRKRPPPSPRPHASPSSSKKRKPAKPSSPPHAPPAAALPARPAAGPSASASAAASASGAVAVAPPAPEYRANRQTLFLAGKDFDTILWEPPAAPPRAAEPYRRHFAPHADRVHAFFTGPHAARHAAGGQLNVYRHVGHVVLRKFQQSEAVSPRDRWFPDLKRSRDELVNMKVPVAGGWCANDRALAALESLSATQRDPWTAPFIAVVAKRKDVVRACDVERYDDDFDLPVQVYIGRLLFELIACHEIRTLFQELVPSVPFTEIPPLPQQPVVYQRSPPVPNTPKGSLATVLRSAESTGYASLTPEQRSKIESVVTVKLYPYQEQTVRWMLDKENNPHSLNQEFWEEHFFTSSPYAEGGSFFYFPMSGEVRLRRPPPVRGGLVAEEMGLGKTVEALAVIAAQKAQRSPETISVLCEEQPQDLYVEDGFVKLQRTHIRNTEKNHLEPPDFHHGDEVLDDVSEVDFPCSVRVRRWPAATTLVVCPMSLLGQWKQEVQKRAPSLSVEVWVPKPRRKGPQSDTSIAIGENAKDIVLATYDMVRTDPNLSRICWRRVILDESQVTRRSAALIARDVFNLRCNTRFLMTGTPLVTSIDDLKGQLACLKVWPFSLEEDGFWEVYVSSPFYMGITSPSLDQVLAHTMMRHSKAQNLNLSLPNRTFETIRVDLTDSHRALYFYVLGSCLDEIEAQYDPHQSRYVDTRRLRPLLKLLISLCLAPDLLDVVALDIARRFTWARRSPNFQLQQLNVTFPMLTPQEAIRFVAESSAGVVRDSNRMFAGSLNQNDEELQKFIQMTVSELRDHVLEKGLLDAGRAQRASKDRLAAVAAGGVHRILSDTLAELRETAVRLGIGESGDVRKWTRSKVRARLVMHYDQLRGIQICRTVHESGFTALTKIIEKKEAPGCPVCLMEVEGRLVVTKCGHLYCHECMTSILGQPGESPRCAICRRELMQNSIAEIRYEKAKKEEEEAEEEQTEEEKAGHKTEVVTEEAGSGDEGSEAGLEAGSEAGSEAGTEAGAEVGAGTVPAMERNPELSVSRPTAEEAWASFDEVGAAPEGFNDIGRDERFPSLGPEVLRHIAASRVGRTAPPKIEALLRLIQSSPDDTKFCVVAGSLDNLRLIYKFLQERNICSVGAGDVSLGLSESRSMSIATERFEKEADVRVFLLNPSNAAGLTLTAASVVVYMETLVRVADEIQAAARVHRIGQTKDVRIVRIITRGTVEENIVARRGEITNAAEESHALATVSNQEASDRLILQLFRPDFDDTASQDSSGDGSDDSDDENYIEYDSSFE